MKRVFINTKSSGEATHVPPEGVCESYIPSSRFSFSCVRATVYTQTVVIGRCLRAPSILRDVPHWLLFSLPSVSFPSATKVMPEALRGYSFPNLVALTRPGLELTDRRLLLPRLFNRKSPSGCLLRYTTLHLLPPAMAGGMRDAALKGDGAPPIVASSSLHL